MKKTLLFLFLLLGVSMSAQPPSTMPPFVTCDENNDGFAIFDLSSQIPAILNGLGPNTSVVSFFESFTDAQTNSNAIANIGFYTNITPQVQTVYIRVDDNANSQVYFSTMDLIVNPLAEAGADGALATCDNATVPIDLFAVIVGGQPGGTWTRMSGAGGIFNAANGTFQPAVGATNSSFLYTVGGGTCPSDSSIAMVIVNNCNTCPAPTAVTPSLVTYNSASLSWTDNAGATSWQIEAVVSSQTPTGIPSYPTYSGTSPFIATGLLPNTCYTFYVRAVCSPTSNSTWTMSTNACTLAAPPACGGNFVDSGGVAANYANNENITNTVCPTTPGDVVTVSFTAFNTEANWDALYVFNGNSVAAPQISSGNPAANVPGGLAGGYWGTVIPGPFVSTSMDGCLTFRFRSDGTGVRAGWVANVSCAPPEACPRPINITTSTVMSTSLSLNWNNPSGATSWEIEAVPTTQTPTGIPTYPAYNGTLPFIATGLLPNTCYTFYVRAVCSPTSSSAWAASSIVCTTVAPPVCGGTFVDAGGTTGNYNANSNTTTTICPSASGDVVTATFTAFNTEVNFDALYVYDGATAVSQIASTNPAANVPGGLPGGFWGTTIPGPFTATNASGCLTFVFRSDNSLQNPGWVANVTCGSPPTCRIPTTLTVSAVTSTSILANWTQPQNPDTTTANAWHVLVLPAGSPVPTASTTGYADATLTPFTVTGLTPATCYTLYVRAVCSATENSSWSAGYNFCTQIAPPVCGGTFVDNGGPSANYSNSSDNTYTICPTNPGDIVTVTFNTFAVEATWDALYVFDGNSIAAPQIASTNPAGNVPGGLAGGYWGTTAPGPFISSSPDGCLTFRFRSDNTQNMAGWTASVFCAPAPDRILLVAFVDSNNNGIKEASEATFPSGNFIYQMNNNGTDINGYTPTGYYPIYDTNPANTYSFSYHVEPSFAPYYSSGTTTYSNISVAAGSGTQVLYFPIILTQSYNDVTVSISPVTAPRPGFTYVNRITYKNLGIAPASGTLTFAKPTQITTFTVSQTGTVNNVSGFTYAFTNLLPNETRTMDVTMTVPAVPIVNLNELLTDTISITAPAGDINPNNNSASNSQIVVNSWDPNDKMESRGKTIPFNTFTQDDYFFYTIRFQNNGTANAIDVRLEDTLNAKIDETSVLLVSASHNYTMKRIGNQLTWEFKNIYLTPSTVNENGSRGYAQFKVKLKPGFQAGDIIPNNASIYFDTNPAVVTANFNSKFTLPLGVTTFDENSFNLYPNPAHNNVQIHLIGTNEELAKVTFYDILGKTIKTIPTAATQSLSVDVSDLSKGVYLVEITSGTNLKLTKKLVIH